MTEELFFTIFRKPSIPSLGYTLWAWGYNGSGSLGINAPFSRSSPVQVGSLSDWIQVDGSYQSVGAVQGDNTLWGWGYNQYGQLGLGNTTTYSSPVQVGSLTDWSITRGMYLSRFGLKTDGTLWAWGYNAAGILGLGDTTNRSSPVQIGSDTDWVSIDAMTASSLPAAFAIKSDGTLWGWGRGNNYQLGNGSTATVSSPTQIGTDTDWSIVRCCVNRRYHVSAIKTDGTLWFWGLNYRGTSGTGVASGTFTSPVQVGALTDWADVAPLASGIVALKTDGTLWAWGDNNQGQLGTNNTTNYSSPVQIGSDTDWDQIQRGVGDPTGSGYGHVVATKTDGTLWGWGYNGWGALGVGDTTNRSSPTQVGSDTTWYAPFSGGYGGTFALKS